MRELGLTIENIEKLAKAISTGFKELQKDISEQEVILALQSAERLGIINRFIHLKIQDETFLVRINGRLWPPYERQGEERILQILKEHRLKSGVLLNRPDENFQICREIKQEYRLDSILLREKQEVEMALEQIATTIVSYQQIPCQRSEFIEHPILDMLKNAISGIKKKLNADPLPQDFCFLQLVAYKAVSVLKEKSQLTISALLSHNDLFSSSIYVEKSGITIVDWEYAGLGFWSNDIAHLSLYLVNEEQFIYLAKLYYEKKFTSSTISFETMLKEIKLNIFVLASLNLFWRVNSNYQQNNEILIKIRALQQDGEALLSELNEQYKWLNQKPLDNEISKLETHASSSSTTASLPNTIFAQPTTTTNSHDDHDEQLSSQVGPQ